MNKQPKMNFEMKTDSNKFDHFKNTNDYSLAVDYGQCGKC